MSDQITVRGGRGGISVSLDALEASGSRLSGIADAAGRLAHRTRQLDVLTLPIMGAASISGLTTLDHEQTAAAGRLSALASRLQVHASRTLVAVAQYRLAEWEALLSISAARVGVPALLLERWRLQRLGLLRDGQSATAARIDVDPETTVELWDVASLVTSQSLLSGGSTIRVIEQPQSGGGSAWVVQIPGTRSWSPWAGEVPNDLTADLELMALRQAALTGAALAALRDAQRSAGRYGSGDRVMLTGHSLGGIAAAAITTDAQAREEFNLTHVVSVGSPIGYLPVPPDVVVLSFEHDGDIVTDLDLVPNPDREGWTTVTRDASGAALPLVGMASGDHDSLTYRETARLAAEAVRTGTSTSLQHWAAGAAPFLRGGAPAPPSASTIASPGLRRRDQQAAPAVVRDYRAGRDLIGRDEREAR